MRILVYLFILDLFFGFNGKLLVLGGISIRHWLFAFVLLGAFIKALLCFKEKWRAEQKEGTLFRNFVKQELSTFRAFDWIVLLFVLLHGIWIILIPYTQLDVKPDALSYALGAGFCITVMFLYFPSVYLLRNGRVCWEKYRKFVMGRSVAAAIVHLVIYVAEKLQWRYDHTCYFMERMFQGWSKLVGGHCVIPKVYMPFYSVRVIYAMSIFLAMSFYFIIGQRKKRYLVWTFLNVLALFTTGIRSLLLGILLGACAFCFLDFVIHHWDKKAVKRVLQKLGIVVLFAVLADALLFQGMNFTRIFSSFSVSQEVLEQGQVQELTWDSTDYSTESEIRGTTNSNTTRILQIKALLQKIKEKPLLGHGFAIAACDMQGLNYIAKVGLIGVLLWAFFLGVFVRRVIRMEKRQRGSALAAVYLVVTVLVAVQFQTLFGSLTMAAAVFLFLDLENKERELMK